MELGDKRGCPRRQWDDKSRMTGDCHVRIREGLEVTDEFYRKLRPLVAGWDDMESKIESILK